MIFWYQKIFSENISEKIIKWVFMCRNLTNYFFNWFLISENKTHIILRISYVEKIRHFLLFSDIRKYILWYQEISLNSWYQKIIFWYQKIDFLISENDFLISETRFFHILKSVIFFILVMWISDNKKLYFLISENITYFFISENYFLISRNRIFDIRKWFSDIRKSISWYKKITVIFLYQEFEFLISKNHFLISKNRILNIKKCFLM